MIFKFLNFLTHYYRMGQAPLQTISKINMMESLSNVGYDKAVFTLNKFATSYESSNKGSRGFRSHALQNLPGAYFTNKMVYIAGKTPYVVLLSTLYPSNGKALNTVKGHCYVYASSSLVASQPSSDNGLYDLTDNKWVRQEKNSDLKKLVEDFATYYKSAMMPTQKGGAATCGKMTKSGKPCQRPRNCGIHTFLL